MLTIFIVPSYQQRISLSNLSVLDQFIPNSAFLQLLLIGIHIVPYACVYSFFLLCMSEPQIEFAKLLVIQSISPTQSISHDTDLSASELENFSCSNHGSKQQRTALSTTHKAYYPKSSWLGSEIHDAQEYESVINNQLTVRPVKSRLVHSWGWNGQNHVLLFSYIYCCL